MFKILFISILCSLLAQAQLYTIKLATYKNVHNLKKKISKLDHKHQKKIQLIKVGNLHKASTKPQADKVALTKLLPGYKKVFFDAFLTTASKRAKKTPIRNKKKPSVTKKKSSSKENKAKVKPVTKIKKQSRAKKPVKKLAKRTPTKSVAKKSISKKVIPKRIIPEKITPTKEKRKKTPVKIVPKKVISKKNLPEKTVSKEIVSKKVIQKKITPEKIKPISKTTKKTPAGILPEKSVSKKITLHEKLQNKIFFLGSYGKSTKGKRVLMNVYFEEDRVNYSAVIGKVAPLKADYRTKGQKLFIFQKGHYNSTIYSKLEKTLPDYYLISSWSKGKKINTIRYYFKFADAKSYLQSLK